MENKISVFNAPITNCVPFKEVTIKDVYTVIVSDKYKAKTESIRQADDDEAKKLKQTTLDHVTFSCICTYRNKGSIKEHSSFVHADIDHVNDIQSLKQKILSNDMGFLPVLLFVSPSGNGLKIVYKVAMEQADHIDYFFALESFIFQKTGVKIDQSCKDVTRACFLCHDPEAYYNEKPDVLDNSFIERYPKLKKEVKPITKNINDVSVIMDNCKTWLNKKEFFITGNRNNYITQLAGAYNRYGIDQNTALCDLLTFAEDGFSESEIKATTESIYRNASWHGTAFFDESQPYQFEGQQQAPIKIKEPKKIPLLPIEGFPKEIQKLITTCFDIYRTPRDFWANDVIAATALAIGKNMTLKTKYTNVPIFWSCKVGNVSDGKTEVQNKLMKPFSKLDDKVYCIYESEMEEYNQEMAKRKGKRKDPDNEPKKPQCFQYQIKDFTPETLHDILKVNPRGVVVDRDEIMGYFDDLNRYNKSGEMSNMLSSFNGVSLVYNRKGAIIRTESPFINFMGGIQPDILPNMAKDGRAENGAIQRFCFAYPDEPELQSYNKKTLPMDIYNDWERFIYNLIELPETQVSLSDEAHNLYEVWYNRNRKIIFNEPIQHLKGAFGKLDIISLRLCIVLKGMKLIYEADYTDTISAEIMQSALNITEYFRATQIKVFHRMMQGATNFKTELKKADVIQWTMNNSEKTQTEIAKFFETSRSQIKRLA